MKKRRGNTNKPTKAGEIPIYYQKNTYLGGHGGSQRRLHFLSGIQQSETSQIIQHIVGSGGGSRGWIGTVRLHAAAVRM